MKRDPFPAPLKLMATAARAAAMFGALMLPAAWALRESGPTTVDGVTTLDDAIAACRSSGLRGWDLATYAQQLVHRKFAIYSCRNLWDTPAGAFRHGMGYCTQYNLALKKILVPVQEIGSWWTRGAGRRGGCRSPGSSAKLAGAPRRSPPPASMG